MVVVVMLGMCCPGLYMAKVWLSHIRKSSAAALPYPGMLSRSRMTMFQRLAWSERVPSRMSSKMTRWMRATAMGKRARIRAALPCGVLWSGWWMFSCIRRR